MKPSTSLIRAFVLYHLAEYQSGNATIINIDLQDHAFKISDNGRGHAISRTINGIPYLRLVYSQFEYPFDADTDTPIQLHTIGMSLINSFCRELNVIVHKKESVYIQYYEAGQLNKEETKQNTEHTTGTAVQGTLNPDLVPEGIDLQDVEQWLIKIKSIHSSLQLFFNGKEL